MSNMTGTRIVGKVYGDLTGSVFEPTVVAIRNVLVSNTQPTNGQVLTYNSASNEYIPSSSQNVISYDQSLNTTDNVRFSRLSVGDVSYVTASGEASLAQGWNTNASGAYSHAHGHDTTALGEASHAEGQDTIASGNYSYAGGDTTIASGTAQTVIGKYNKEGNDYSLFVVGNGSSVARSDIFLVNSDNIIVSGGLQTVSASLINGTSSNNYAVINAENTFTAVQSFNSGISASEGRVAGNFTVIGTASFGVLNAIQQNELRVGDKFIVITSGSEGHTEIDGSGILWGSGSQIEGDTLDANGCHAHITYTGGTVDRLDIFPGINTTAISASQYSGAMPYDVLGEKVGRPKVSETIYRMRTVRPYTISSTGSYFESIVTASAQYNLQLLKDATQIGTASFGVGSSSADISFATNPTFAVGELFNIKGQASRDTTLSDVFFIFKGNTL